MTLVLGRMMENIRRSYNFVKFPDSRRHSRQINQVSRPGEHFLRSPSTSHSARLYLQALSWANSVTTTKLSILTRHTVTNRRSPPGSRQHHLVIEISGSSKHFPDRRRHLARTIGIISEIGTWDNS